MPATLNLTSTGQASKLLKLLGDRNVSAKHLDLLLQEGIISDLLSASTQRIKELSRESRHQAIGICLSGAPDQEPQDSASLEQVAKLLQLLHDRRVSASHVQFLLASGTLSDLFGSRTWSLRRVTRNDRRSSLLLSLVYRVDRSGNSLGDTWRDRIKKAGFQMQHVDLDFWPLDKVLRNPKRGAVDFQLVQVSRGAMTSNGELISSSSAFEQLQLLGYPYETNADLEDLLDFAAVAPNLPLGESRVVALGACVSYSPFNDMRIAYLLRSEKGGRRLLHWNEDNWLVPRTYFLVRV